MMFCSKRCKWWPFRGLVLLALLVLAGCGGGSGNNNGSNGNTNPVPVSSQYAISEQTNNGTVDLPAGATSAVVLDSLGHADVTNGKFSLPAYGPGRQLTIVESANGNPMLLGFVGPGHTAITARTTADVLVYFATGAFIGTADQTQAALDKIEQMPDLDALATTISTALAKDPDAFASGGSGFTTLTQALQNLLATVVPQPSVTTSGIVTTPAPADIRSGINVNDDQGVNSIYLTYRYRRPGYAYIDRVSTFDNQGNETPDPAPLTEFDVPEVTGLKSLTGTLTDIIYGNDAYQEQSTAPVQLPALPGAAKTRYQLTVVGPGHNAGDEAQLDQVQIDKLHHITQVYVIKDLFLPLVLNFILPNKKVGDFLDDTLKFDGGGDLVGELISILTKDVPDIWSESYQGDLSGALHDAFDTFKSSDTLRNAIGQKILDYITSNHGFAAAKTALDNGKWLLTVIQGANYALNGLDAVAVGASYFESDRADIWTIDVTPPKVRLDPANTSINLGASQDLTATVPELSGSGVNLVYHWSCAGNFGQLTDTANSQHINTFDSSLNTVTYTADDFQTGTETVTVEVYALSGASQSGRQLVGKASATLTIKEAPCGIPNAVVSIPYAPLADLIRGQLSLSSDAAITCSDMQQLTSMPLDSSPNFGSGETAPLEGLESAQNLDSFTCGTSCLVQQQGFAPIQSLTSLTSVVIDGGLDDSSLGFLGGLTNVTYLDLQYNTFTTLAPLSGLTKVQQLNLSWCSKLTSLEGLEGMPSLQTLNLSETGKLTSLAPLAGDTAMTQLDGKDCGALDSYAALQNMSQLTYLNLDGTKGVADANVQPLGNKPKLTTLILTYDTLTPNSARITDISGLATDTGLQDLELGPQNITNISALTKMTQLTKVNLASNQISDLSPLAGLSQLSNLDLSDNLISDLSPLAGLSGLTDLSLGANQITDITPLDQLQGLQQLSLAGNPNLTDISALSNLQSLNNLSIASTGVSSVKPLVDNNNFGGGAILDVSCSPAAGDTANLNTLQARGVTILSQGQCP